MARPLRLQFEYALYHVTSRGNARQAIVKTQADRQAFLTGLAQVVDRFGWRCHAYCLMNNHYHVLVETPVPNLSQGMRQLNGPYTQGFNRRHRRVGHVFQGRYKAILVEREAHLLELCRYVVLNPVRAQLVDHPEDWAWSNYRATAGLEPCPPFLEVGWTWDQLAIRPATAQRRYQAFVAQGIGQESPWEHVRGQVYLGDETFVAQHQPGKPLPEIARQQTQAVRPRLSTLLPRNHRSAQAIAEAYRTHGYRMREIAHHVGVHYSTISRRLRQVETKGA